MWQPCDGGATLCGCAAGPWPYPVCWSICQPSWGNHSGARNCQTWGPAVHSAAPRPGSPDKHHQCPGSAILPWTFLYQWAGLAAGAIPGPQRPGSKGLPASDPGELWTRPKLLWDADSESFACSLQPGLLPQAQNITIPENLVPGSKVVQVQARGFDVRYEILSPVPCRLFSIGRVDGVVRTTSPLELAQAPDAAVTRLRVKAFERLRPWASAELDFKVDVQSVNRWPPRCTPALLATQIPETTPVGTVLNTFTCTDPDSPGSTLDYQLLFHSPAGAASLCLQDRVLEVNATLDCDTPGTCFHHAASILVLDGGQPLMTTEVPVLVMVTPVNEFSPACVPRTFRVREDAGPHALLGSVVGKDMDYPHDSIEYSIPGGSATFAVDRLSGEVRLLGPLDYELQKFHRLTVLLTDHSQDQDPTCHRSGSCTITIEVEDVNDHAPECEPPFQELTIHTHLGRSMEVTRVSCRVPQEPQRLAFSYSIVGGNSWSQFSLQGAVLVLNDLTLGPSWPEQPHTYELLIRVADAGPSTPHLSTTATVIVHLVPWRASTVATSTHRATVTSMMTPLLVTDTEAFWQPEPWFVVVLTVTSALLLLALGWLLSRLLWGLAQVLQVPSKPTQALLLNSIQGTEGSVEGFMEAPRMETPQAPSSVMSLQYFDGRAQDPRESPSFQTILYLGPLSFHTPFQYLCLPPGILSTVSLNGVSSHPHSPLSQCLPNTWRT
ncbi:cadherin-related family member 4 isoform X3 [Delphinapterus leucas]|uniref:Cadherin-related family member 4 isoform X3 n=1 Tax=Delphinapterus leucas TaxID=9749 RepID=A0A2Y9N292_DELLE|nr:cadherin-related family member 4 isoform X3 [Delphinapterus leucas]XP_022428809.1 cadherin-related family member 4 isoform X3 [Delphinapterus leucas]